MREEWRAEQEAATRDAAEQWRHSRTLLDLAREHMHRGDRVAITVGRPPAAGEIVEVATDRIALFDDERRTDVHLIDSVPLAFTIVERAAFGRSHRRAHGVVSRPAARARSRGHARDRRDGERAGHADWNADRRHRSRRGRRCSERNRDRADRRRARRRRRLIVSERAARSQPRAWPRPRRRRPLSTSWRASTS